MEINVLEDKKNRMVLELIGEGHGFCNALRKNLWSVKGVSISGYTIEHPLVASPKITAETDGAKAPKDAFLDAAKLMKKDSNAFLKAFSKQVK